VDAIAEGPTPVSPAALAAAGKRPVTDKRTSVVDRDKCIGCGVCVIGCVPNAITMEPVSEAEWFHVPSSMAEWEERRLTHLAAQNT
jgi:NAD-dependent dihydropyrimidine dehydrogenase PreA subunit